MVMSDFGDAKPEVAAAYIKTIEEVCTTVCSGTVDGPSDFGDMLVRFGQFFNVARRFGIQQGLRDGGTPKFRAIR